MKLNEFSNKLDEKNIFYKLGKVREEAVMVEVAVPDQRWKIEFLDDGTVEIEKFLSDGNIYDEAELDTLIKEFSG